MTQLLHVGIDRCKTDAFIDLVEWSEEENHQLKKLNWTGVSIEDNFKNREHKHLTYLFELECTISIAPGKIAPETQLGNGNWVTGESNWN